LLQMWLEEAKPLQGLLALRLGERGEFVLRWWGLGGG